MKLADLDLEKKEMYYIKALQYHTKHKNIGDEAGKFLAHINLGIVYNTIGDFEQASVNHHFALRYAT